MAKVLAFLKKEFLEVIPPTIFFFISFHIIAVTRALMLQQHGIGMTSMAGATIAALVVAKVLLVADHFPLINKFPEKPLIYNVVWKTIIYLLASLVVRFSEHVIKMWPEGGSLSDAVGHVFQELSWPRFLAIQIWLLVLLFVYTSLREFIRAIGRDRVLDIFFRTGAKALS